MNDPQTPAEWQEAVDGADIMLAIETARLYNLIDTDLEIDVDRCQELLDRGKAIGIEPRVDVIDRVFKVGG